MWGLFLELLFPRRCLGCGQRTSLLCEACEQTLPPAPALAGAITLYDYDHPLTKKIIWRLKYGGLKSLGEELAPRLLDGLLPEVAEAAVFSKAPLLVAPIPLATNRWRQRGYNQAAVLARELCRLLPEKLIYSPQLLRKTKSTPSQVSLKNRAARLSNLRGVFAVPPEIDLRGRTVVVVDDVITTGGTMMAANEALRQAGAETVIPLALAHGE